MVAANTVSVPLKIKFWVTVQFEFRLKTWCIPDPIPRLATYPPTGMKNIKRSFNMALESSLSATLTLEAEYDAACYRSTETRQALKNFIESRKKK